MTDETVDPLPAANVVLPHSQAEIDHILINGDPDRAGRISSDIDFHGYGNKTTLVLWLFLGVIVFTIQGTVFAMLDYLIGVIMLEIAALLTFLIWLLAFRIFRPDNPIREYLRRTALFCCYNRRLHGAMVQDTKQFFLLMSAILSVPGLLTAVVMSSVLFFSTQHRANTHFIKGTVSVWIIGLVCFFPLGGYQRMLQWGRDLDIANNGGTE